MRIAPDGVRYVYRANQGTPGATPMVTLVDGDGAVHELGDGGNARWLRSGVVWNSQAGRLKMARAADWSRAEDIGAGGHIITSAPLTDRWALSDTDPHRIVRSWTPQILTGATAPALSDDGDWWVYLRPDVPPGRSTLVLERCDGEAFYDATRREWVEEEILSTAAPMLPRWASGGTTLMWEDAGVLYGVTTPGQPPVRFPSISGRRSLHKPVAIWVPDIGQLWVLCTDGDGEILLAEWGSLARGAARGRVLGRSEGAGYDHDARPIGGAQLRVRWLAPTGPDGSVVDLTRDLASLAKPVIVEPPTPADEPFVVDPHGVVEDIWPWILAHPDASLSPDGRVVRIAKSDEISADGRVIGEWWDTDGVLIGHLEDASAGYRIYSGQRYSAEAWVRLGEPVPWATLPIDRNWFSAGARLWLPRRCVTGYRQRYVTDIRWTSGRVQPRIPIEIRVDVGRGRINGREVRVRGVYSPGGRDEINYYGPTGWVSHTPAS